ncbi:hypothetical protein [Enterococcus casseliflavus]
MIFLKSLRRSAFLITTFFLGVWFSSRQLPDWASLRIANVCYVVADQV